MTEAVRRRLALGGVLGPLIFVATWALLGARRDGYSPVHDPISRLAAVDAPTRAAMSGGLVAFGVGVGAYAVALRTEFPAAAAAAATTAVASIGIALTPLGSQVGGVPHAVAAGVAYASLAATPALAVRSLWRRGRRSHALASAGIGAACATALVASAVAPRYTGLFQRTGLTVGDVWLVASASALSFRRR